MNETVAYIGNFGPDHSTENHYARSFEAIGCTVVRIQENAEATPFDAIAQALEQVGRGVDLLLYTRTWGLDQDRFQHLLAAAKAHGVRAAAVHLDRWQGLDREHEVTGQVMFRMEHVFTADGDAEETFWSERDVNHHWLSAGVLRDECVEADPFDRSEYPWDIAFVGSRTYHHEWPVRPALIDWLAETYGDRFVHVGGDGQIPGEGRALRGGDLNRLYATVPVIVGDSCYARPGAHYWSDRFYETYGRGGYLIFPRIDLLRDEVGDYPSWSLDCPVIEEPGRRFVLDEPSWQRSLASLRIAIDLALSDRPRREADRQRLHALVRNGCSYEDRAQTILETIGLRLPAVTTFEGTMIVDDPELLAEECVAGDARTPTVDDLERNARYQTHAAVDSIFDYLAAKRESEAPVEYATVLESPVPLSDERLARLHRAFNDLPFEVARPDPTRIVDEAVQPDEPKAGPPTRYSEAEASIAGFGE